MPSISERMSSVEAQCRDLKEDNGRSSSFEIDLMGKIGIMIQNQEDFKTFIRNYETDKTAWNNRLNALEGINTTKDAVRMTERKLVAWIACASGSVAAFAVSFATLVVAWLTYRHAP